MPDSDDQHRDTTSDEYVGGDSELAPELIRAAPFAVPVLGSEAVEDSVTPPVITAVPTSPPEPVAVVADLPDEPTTRVRTPWWRLMLGGGAPRRQPKRPVM
ncbi:MAG: hypothetical protein HY829_08300 [Actinobacteria bacterium]|nr:hypothetical protein [Actinomycetota bacterium]